MPKIIKDIDKTIKKSAIQLFIEYDYDNVDMKMISKNCGIAVGTIYNHYKNKKELYFIILEESWQNTFNKLDEINSLTTGAREKSKEFIKVLYEDIEARNGLGKALINNSSDNLNEDEGFINLKRNLILRVEKFFSLLNKVEDISKCSNVSVRLAESLLASILIMLDLHPNEKEENIIFLVELVNLSIEGRT